MKTESLHALLIDRDLGELTPESAELLAAWLAEHPETARQVEITSRSVDVARTALQRFPELARVPEAGETLPRLSDTEAQPANVIPLPETRSRWRPLAVAASVALLLGGAGWIGFLAGADSVGKFAGQNPPTITSPPVARSAKPSGPWARYSLASNSRGGLTVVRRDSNPQR